MSELEPIDNLYDFEIDKINELTKKLWYKWHQKKPTIQNLKEFETEVKGRFNDIGYVAELNAVEFLQDVLHGNFPPAQMEIVVVSRIEGIGEFDHERKGHEVRASRAKGGN
jgi:hypothetical protein